MISYVVSDVLWTFSLATEEVVDNPRPNMVVGDHNTWKTSAKLRWEIVNLEVDSSSVKLGEELRLVL